MRYRRNPRAGRHCRHLRKGRQPRRHRQRIVSSPAVEVIVARVALEQIPVGPTDQRVVSSPAEQRALPRLSVEVIVIGTAFEPVYALAPNIVSLPASP